MNSCAESCLESGCEAGEPILFLYPDETGKFHLVDHTRKMLESLTEPVAIVSVCGRARQGKSFLLNQLLGRSSGFEVEASFIPRTFGIWLWSSPLWRVDCDGNSYNLLFIDTEAIDVFPGNEKRGIQIVSLAVALSSMFIYNQMGSIDGVSLHLLSRLVEMTKQIHRHASQDKDAAWMLEQCSPILFWLLRDFHLGMGEGDHVITPQEHLEDNLETVEPGRDGIAGLQNKMRESIRAFFLDRECHTLVRPVIDENELGLLDQIESERLKPEFRDGLASLRMSVLERTRPKNLGEGRMMTGPILARITQIFIDVLNSSGVPSLWQQRVEEDVCLKAYASGERCFRNGVDFHRLLGNLSKRNLEENLSDSMSLFDVECNSVCMGNGLLRKIYRMSFKSALEKKILELLQAAEKRVAHGNLASERVVALGKSSGNQGPASAGRFRDVGFVIPNDGAHICPMVPRLGEAFQRKKLLANCQRDQLVRMLDSI